MRYAEISVVLFAVAVLCALLAIIVLRRLHMAERTDTVSGMELAGRVIASDTGVMPPILLRDPVLGLCGRPDYLFLVGPPEAGRMSPLEVKPTRTARRLFESDELQTAAYVMLSRAHYGTAAADEGYVLYADTTHQVRLTRQLEQNVMSIVRSVREARRAHVLRRSHDSPAKCRSCPVRSNCDEAL